MEIHVTSNLKSFRNSGKRTNWVIAGTVLLNASNNELIWSKLK